ncbi:MAG: hypothetical protein IPH82_02605 [Chloroflexi bacterium]|nr:hypothetical protein [Chloroflexota bacterium]
MGANKPAIKAAYVPNCLSVSQHPLTEGLFTLRNSSKISGDKNKRSPNDPTLEWRQNNFLEEDNDWQYFDFNFGYCIGDFVWLAHLPGSAGQEAVGENRRRDWGWIGDPDSGRNGFSGWQGGLRSLIFPMNQLRQI